MALPTYGLLGAGSAMLQAPGGQGIGQTVGQGLSGFLSGVPADAAAQRTAQTRKTLNDVAEQWRAGAQQLAQQNAIPISYLSRVATVESNNRNVPQSVNDTGSAFGPFQFTSGTWRDQITKHPELGLTEQDRFNPAAQGRVAVTFTRDNRDQLQSALGRAPTAGDLLLAHRFGAQGAISLLNSPRGTSVAKVMPDAAAANPQWQQLTVGQIIDNTQKAAGGAETQPERPRGGGGLLGSSPTPSTAPSTSGLTALFGGVPLAPMGSALENMTPEFRNILAIALSDPTLGPMALQTIIQAGLSGGGSSAPTLKPTDKIINALATGKQPGTPEFEKAVLGGEEGVKPTEIMKEAAALYPDDPTAQRDFIKSYREKTTGVTVQNIPQALPVNKAVADKFEGDIAAGDSARSALGRIEAAKMALQQINTGAGAGMVANVGAYLRSAGIDPTTFGIPDTASPAEAINAITAPMILELRGSKGGEGGMPGNLSDADLRFLKSSTIGLEKQPGANQAILMVQERLQQRKLELEQLAANHAESNNGQVSGGYINERLRYVKSHPLFDDAFKQEFESVLKSPGVAVTAGPAGATPKSAITPVAPNTPTSPGGTAPSLGPPEVTDQKSYDALAPGTTYQSGGKLYKKPGKP